MFWNNGIKVHVFEKQIKVNIPLHLKLLSLVISLSLYYSIITLEY